MSHQGVKMDIKVEYNGTQFFSDGRGWDEKAILGDCLWQQVSDILNEHKIEMPETPRKPDVRLILNNVTGQEMRFLNPGDHSGSKEEVIPGTGDKTAVMVMLHGKTLEEQQRNAQELVKYFFMEEKGFSHEFLHAMKNGILNDVVREAYGPAPFQKQASGLKDKLVWKDQFGGEQTVTANRGQNVAFGAREGAERVFLTHFDIHVAGTTTTAELVEATGMCIAINNNWETGKDETRPIVPSVAVEFYGKHFPDIPLVKATAAGRVRKVIMPNGSELEPSVKPVSSNYTKGAVHVKINPIRYA